MTNLKTIVSAYRSNPNQKAFSVIGRYTREKDKTLPVIIIDSPTSDPTYNISGNTINISGTASDNVEVTEVTWVNSTTGGSGVAVGTTSWSIANIPLDAGNNSITITARDPSGRLGTDSITVN